MSVRILRSLWPIDHAEAMLDGGEAHSLAITAIERERDPHPLTVVAADLKATPAVAPIAGDASVMSRDAKENLVTHRGAFTTLWLGKLAAKHRSHIPDSASAC